jgi:hypothetical protein
MFGCSETETPKQPKAANEHPEVVVTAPSVTNEAGRHEPAISGPAEQTTGTSPVLQQPVQMTVRHGIAMK